jgi:hypothetical protein
MKTFKDRVLDLEAVLGGPAALAKAAGVTTSAVAQWKSSGKPEQLKAAPLLRLQQNTGVRPAWVVFGTGPMKEKTETLVVLEGSAETAYFLQATAAFLESLPELPRAMAATALHKVVDDPKVHGEVSALLEQLKASALSSKPGSLVSEQQESLRRTATGAR